MSFKESLHLVTTNVYTKMLVPSWPMGFTGPLRKISLAFDELEVVVVSVFNACVILAVHARDDTRPTVL
jgi:hypothetical protein